MGDLGMGKETWCGCRVCVAAKVLAQVEQMWLPELLLYGQKGKFP